MNMLIKVLVFSFVTATTGCAQFIPSETLYLRSARDRATQQEVEQQLGHPALTASNERGEAVWVYRVRGEQPGNRMTPPGMWCDEYVLTFDREAVLREWTHRSEFHGGELMPTYCVSGGYAS